MMFTPVSLTWALVAPHRQFLPSLLLIKSGGSLPLKCGTANIQASMLSPRNVKNPPHQKSHPEATRGSQVPLWRVQPFSLASGADGPAGKCPRPVAIRAF